MPTGYTHPIAEGISFQQFTLNCARAFGALIEMRDEPADAVIPDEFKPSDYNKEALDKARAMLAEVQAMTEEECAIKASAQYEETKKRYETAIQDGLDLLAKYRAMLKQVNEWQAPSDEHKGLKAFMREQITSSIDHDCSGTYYQDQLAKLKTLSGEEWRAEQIEAANKGIAYHTKGYAEEVERVNKRTEWVQKLKASLQPCPPPPSPQPITPARSRRHL